MAKKKEENIFDWPVYLDELEISDMLKAGLKYYIESNKLAPKDEKEFNKILDDFKKVKME